MSRSIRLSAWDRYVAGVAAVSAVVTVLSAAHDVAVGGWGTLTGWAVLWFGGVLLFLSAASLVGWFVATPANRTWAGVWIPLVAAVLDVGLVAAVWWIGAALRG